MPRPDDRDQLVLDWLYGLLDPAAAADVAAQVAADPDWAAARDRVTKARGLMAAAAKSAFPAVSFKPPAEPVAAPARKRAVRASMLSAWTRWAVAAGLLLAFAGFGAPALIDAVGYKAYRGAVDRELAAVTAAKAGETAALAARDARKAQVEQRLAKAKAAREELESGWIAAEVAAVNLGAAQPFAVRVNGPTTAVPGALNEYTIAVTDRQNKPYPAKVEVAVRDAAGKEIHAQTFDPEKSPDGNKFRLPPGVWEKVPTGTELFLAISAVDAKTGARSDLTESLRMLEPTYTTFLTTDKPMYRPGETVYFRSLTLDRFRYLPPTTELPLKFVVLKPDGTELPGSETSGLAKPTAKAKDGLIDPVLGPDGKPVRGVGTGAVAVAADLPGGEYTLQVWELPRPGRPAAENKGKPLAVRKFLVNNFTPPTFQQKLEWVGKSFGPGDTVGFTVECKDQAAAMADTPVAVTVDADGKSLKPARVPARTDQNGKAFVEFALPAGVDEIKRATVTVTVSKMNGDHVVKEETLVKAVPLATRKLTVEFFPEGGDLIAGVPNRVYFRATTSAGKPADIAGWLTDGARDIARVATLTDAEHPGVNQGMGAFEFTPEPGTKYAVRLETPSGILQPQTALGNPAVAAGVGGLFTRTRPGYPLPDAKADGLAMTVPTGVSKPGEPIKVTLHPAGKTSKAVLVGAYTRGQPIAHARAELTPGKPTDVVLDPGAVKLGGVTRVTVFDLPHDDAAGRDDLKPLVERLVYRQPGERLNLAFTVKRNGKPLEKGQYLTPGAAVELEVSSKDEGGADKPAVLWTAVVNNSVIVDADEKTRHALPTHFLLTGEVQKGDELEHSDFLLTDHPKAAAGLDLLLGTQGWRRFAEQPNAEFRRKVPAELKEQLQLVSATNGPIPTGWQPAFRRVFDEYWPKYEASLIELESAEQAQWEYRASGDPEADVRRAKAAAQQQLAKFGTVVVDLEPYDAAIVRRSEYLPFIIGFLAVAAGGLLIVRQMGLKPTEAARKHLAVGAVGLLVLAALTAGTTLVSGDNAGWRAVAKDPNTPKPQRGEMYATKRAAPAMGRPDVAGFDDAAAMPMVVDGLAPRAKRAAAEAERDRFALDKGEGKAGGGAFAPEGMPFGGGGGLGGGGRGRPGFAPPPPAGPGGPGGFPQPPGMPAAPAPGLMPVPGPVAPLAGAGPADGNQAKPARNLDDKAKQLQRGGKNDGMPAAGKPGMPAGDLRGDLAPGAAAAGLAGEPLPGGFGAVRGAGGFGGMPGRGLRAEQQMGQVNDVFNMAKLEFREKRKQILGEVLRKTEAGKGAADKLQQLNLDAAGLVENLLPRLTPLPVREYAHARVAAAAADDRTDFTETLLWQPVLVTPANGKAAVTFALSDQVNPYEVLIAGHTLDGRLGSVSGVIEVRKAFSVGTKLPAEIGSSDKIDLPVIGVNEADAVRTGEVTLTPDGLSVVGPNKVTLDLGAGSGGRKVVRLTPTRTEGRLGLKLDGVAGTDTDSFTHRAVTVVPDGYPAGGEKSDVLEKSVSLKLLAPKMIVPGSLKARVTVYPNTLSEIQAGLDGLLREPYGCFEQTSTTNYPNVLILDYLGETGQVKPDVAAKAKGLIDRGYQKLTSFECQVPSDPTRKGYEWFGGTAPPHEALTAYGLLQFTDMSRVHPVDAEMMARTKKYLLGQRDGKGGFARNARALDTFGRAPDHITNAYIVWALTESEKWQADKSDLSKEIAALQKAAEGVGAKDPYFLALLANSLANVGKRADAEKLLTTVGELQANDGSIPGAETSVTCSSGQALLIEATGLAVLGWLKANDTGTYRKNVDAAARWIGSQRGGYGGFGSTQSTILALKALIDYARSNKRPAESGWVKVSVGGKELVKKDFTTEQTGPIVLDLPDAEKLLETGAAELTVETSARQAYPVTASWEARTRQPLSSDKCAVALTTKLTATEIGEAGSVRLDVTMTNLQDKGQGMAVAIIGLPAGLSLPQDMKQLRDLTRRPADDTEPTVSYFEIKGRELILYWRGMSPKQKVELSLDLIAETPGEYKGPASRAYLYYGAEHKQWVAPLDVTVKAK